MDTQHWEVEDEIAYAYWKAARSPIARCVIPMLRQESWADSQKLAGKTWRIDSFCWDCVSGVPSMTFLSASASGSTGHQGRSLLGVLGEGTAMVAASWSVFTWREFREVRPGTDRLTWLMFPGYILGPPPR